MSSLTDMKIRPAEEDDVNILSAMAITLARKFITCDFPQAAENYFLNTLKPKELRKNMLTDISYLAAEQEGKLLGFIGMKNYEHVFHLFVAEAYQGKGIARKLWNAAMQQSLLSGNPGKFTVNASLYARPVYEKLGFVAQSGPRERNNIVTIPMKFILSGKV